MSNQWVRTIALEGLLPAAGIAGTPLELFANGYTPESLGMLELGATTEKVRIPVIDGIGIALNRPTEVRFVDKDDTELFGAEFEDEHPRDWLNTIAAQRQALLVIAPKPLGDYPTFTTWLTEAWVGMLPTTIYAWPDGVGVTPSA